MEVGCVSVPVKKEQISVSCRDFFRDQFGPLQQKGRRFWARCPFHNEKTASFVVDESRFHCFSCGADGDLFELAKKAWNCTFPEAVESLAAEYGAISTGPIIRQNLKCKQQLHFDDTAEFDSVFFGLIEIREAMEGWLRQYRPGDEIPGRLMADFSKVQRLIESMLFGSEADREEAKHGGKEFTRWMKS